MANKIIDQVAQNNGVNKVPESLPVMPIDETNFQCIVSAMPIE